MTIITTSATFAYFDIIHPKFILGFLEKIIKTFEKKRIPSQLTRCKWQLKGKICDCKQI
jgi:hypothetical protein